MMLSNELRSILEEASHSFRPGHKPDTNNIQLLLCGDFNSLPDSGKLYILLQNKYFCDIPDLLSTTSHLTHLVFPVKQLLEQVF
jgi:CCR4-NOT transcription complex subunit 6